MDRCRPAFSLVELIVVVAVIGIFTSIAIPHFAPLSEGANIAKDRFNAQNIVTTYTTGSAAGVQWPTGDVAAKVTAVITGRNSPGGVFANTLFQSTVTADMAVTTYPFIGVQSDGGLFYDPTASQDPGGH